jgi:NADPH:quinone reductase-like Zn-dependent oxidoreductase
MKSAIYKKYGTPEVIHIIEKKKPSPKPNELLVRIKASSATRADTLMRQGIPKFGRLFLGLFKPKNTSLGTGFSGIVESVGEEVTKFKISDEVFGEVLFSDGTNSEYVRVREDGVIKIKPKTISHQEAAPICDGFLTSYSFLRDVGHLKEGQHILINGASGSLGLAAVQLSKLMGAKVTGVCSASNLNLVKSLGADIVVDYKKSDFSKAGDYYDVIYDAVGKTSYKNCKKVLYYNGIFMSPVLTVNILWRSIISPKKVKFSATGMRKSKDLKKLLSELVAYFKEGKLNTVIERTYSLDNIIEAHKHLDSGHKIGNIVITNQ